MNQEQPSSLRNVTIDISSGWDMPSQLNVITKTLKEQGLYRPDALYEHINKG